MQRRAPRRRLLGLLLSIGLAVALPSAAIAQNVGALDKAPATPGHVVQDAAGTAYIAWTRKAATGVAETPEFCKVPKGGKACTTPITLPVPAPAESVDSPSAAVPVLGPGTTVYVVAPRYPQNDVLLYTSTDGGASFAPAQVITGSYSSKSNPTEVLLSGNEFLISGYNPGIGFSAVSTAGAGLGDFILAEPGPGGVASESLGLDSAGNPVQAWYNLNSGQYTIDFAHYKGAGSKTLEADWTGLQEVGKGYNPSLAGGSSGLYMVSQDYNSSTETYPSAVEVRKYNGSSFGAPVRLFDDKAPDLFAGGAIAESPAGHVAVAWPQFAGGKGEMHLFISTNGGASFVAEPNVAGVASAYLVQANASMSLGDDNQGWVTYLAEGTLQLANLGLGATFTEPPPTTTTHIGTDNVTLAGPKGCVRPGQTVKVSLTVASAKRKGRVVLKIYKVIFAVDGVPFKTIVRESVRKTGRVNPHPYTASVLRTFTAGTKHTISSQAFISEMHGRHATRTLRVSFFACS